MEQALSKVLVAEQRNGELNVIGVSNAKSKGVRMELLLILMQQQLLSNQPFPKQKKRQVISINQ